MGGRTIVRCVRYCGKDVGYQNVILWVPNKIGTITSRRKGFGGKSPLSFLRSFPTTQASASSFTGPVPVFGLSTTTLRTNLRKWALKEQQISWQQNPGCRRTKLHINGPNPGLAKFALSLRKQDLRLLTGLLTGHVSLNRHLTIMKLRSDPLCRSVRNIVKPHSTS